MGHALSSHQACVLVDNVVEGLARHGVHRVSLAHHLSIACHVEAIRAIPLCGSMMPMPCGVGVVAAHDCRVPEVIRAKQVDVAAPALLDLRAGAAKRRRRDEAG